MGSSGSKKSTIVSASMPDPTPVVTINPPEPQTPQVNKHCNNIICIRVVGGGGYR